MIRPPYLRKGDIVGIVAPAGCLTEVEIMPAVEIIQSWGLKVVFGEHLYHKRGSFAGTDLQRTRDMQKMLDDRHIKAILCARGGYGTIRIIDKLDFEKFKKYPKWIAGYSDITVLHAALQNCVGSESIHGVMPRTVPPKKPDMVSFDTLRALLFGDTSEYTVPAHPLSIEGKATGMLVGGNLSVLYSLAGTTYDLDTSNKILFIEDLNEYLYHVDRMIMNLKIRKKLSGLKGLIAGDMTGMKGSSPGFHKPAYEIIREATAEYGFPVIFGFPSGHGSRNLALPIGREVTMHVDRNYSRLMFP